MQLDANFSELRRLHSYKLRVKTVGRYLHGQFPETRSTGEVVGLAGREGGRGDTKYRRVRDSWWQWRWGRWGGWWWRYRGVSAERRELCILDKARLGREGKGRAAACRLVSSVSVTTMPGICYTGIVIVTVQISHHHTTSTALTTIRKYLVRMEVRMEVHFYRWSPWWSLYFCWNIEIKFVFMFNFQ